MFQPIVLFVVMAMLSSAVAFAKLPVQLKNNKIRTESNMKLKVFLAPQIVFIASCAGAVFAYVYTNLDSIMAVSQSAKSYVMSFRSVLLTLFTYT